MPGIKVTPPVQKSPVQESPVRLHLRTDCSLISASQVTKRMIEIELGATAVSAAVLHTARRDRSPLNLALVIDRSGSMGGSNLHYVKEATLHVLGVLADTDHVTLIAYDDAVDTLLAPGPLSPERRARAIEQVAALEPGGSTALFDGWRTGADLVAGNPVPHAVTRVFLLTDGLANHGESRPEILEHHAQEMFARGVATSTFGVGTEFNQFLLEGMAARGGGSYRFIEAPGQIPAMFGEELGQLLATSARNVEITLTVPRGSSLSLLGNLPHTTEGNTLRIPVGALYADQPRTFFLEALLPPRGADSGLLTIPVVVSGTAAIKEAVAGTEAIAGMEEPGGGSLFQISETVNFTWAGTPEVQAAPVLGAVRQAAARVRVAAAETDALRLEYAGEGTRGAQVLEYAIAACAADLDSRSAEELAQFARRLRQSERLDPAYSKGRHAAAYRSRRGES